MTNYRISLINHNADETVNNDLIVVKGLVDKESEDEDEEGQDDEEGNEFAANIVNRNSLSESDEDDKPVVEDDPTPCIKAGCINIVQKGHWSNNIKIMHVSLSNVQVELPFQTDGRAFTFLTILQPGANKIEFVEKIGGKCVKQFVFNYQPPTISGSEINYSVVPILLLCRDEEHVQSFLDTTVGQIELCMKIIQAFFKEKLFEHGLGNKSFSVESEVTILKSNLTMGQMSRMSSDKVWENLALQIRSSDGVWDPSKKYIGFVLESCLREGEGSGGTHTVMDKLACGGGGLAFIGFNSFGVWPLDYLSILCYANDGTKLLGADLIDIAVFLGNLESTRGSLFCAAMGAIAHELGHVFNLGHSGRGLMGKDFFKFQEYFTPVRRIKVECQGCSNMSVGRCVSKERYPQKKIAISLTHSSAMILSHHRWFTGPRGFEEEWERKGPSLEKNKVVSTSPLVAVEIRHHSSGLVVNNIEFRNNTCELSLSKRDILVQAGDDAQLVAQDCKGNFLKTVVSRINLPNTFTSLSS